MDSLPVSKVQPGRSNDLSKRDQTNGKNHTDNLYARLRKLERLVENQAALLSAVRRDVSRIDRRQLRKGLSLDPTPTVNEPLPGQTILGGGVIEQGQEVVPGGGLFG